METVTFELNSVTAMLQHSDRFSNPLDAGTKAHKALTSKRKKTDQDHELIARSEFMGSLYWDSDIGVYLPTQNIRASLIGGAKLNRLGTHVARGTVFLEEKAKLIYDGPQTPDTLWENPEFVDARSVVVQRSRLMRYRPRFNTWSLQTSLLFDASQIEKGDLIAAMENAGSLIGVGDYRPLFGRFSVKVVS